MKDSNVGLSTVDSSIYQSLSISSHVKKLNLRFSYQAAKYNWLCESPLKVTLKIFTKLVWKQQANQFSWRKKEQNEKRHFFETNFGSTGFIKMSLLGGLSRVVTPSEAQTPWHSPDILRLHMTCIAVECRHAIDTHKNYLTSNVKSVFFKYEPRLRPRVAWEEEKEPLNENGNGNQFSHSFYIDSLKTGLLVAHTWLVWYLKLPNLPQTPSQPLLLWWWRAIFLILDAHVLDWHKKSAHLNLQKVT